MAMTARDNYQRCRDSAARMLLDGELKGWAHTKLGWETHERRISYLREQEANNAAALRLIEDGWKENYPAPEEYFEAARRIQRRLAGAETGRPSCG